MNKKDTNSRRSIVDDIAFDQYSLEDWRALAEKSLRGASIASLAHSTASGLTIDPLYAARPESNLAVPPSPMQRWDNRLMVIGASAKQQNETLLAGLRGGISSAQIHLDSPEKTEPVNAAELPDILKDVQLAILPVSLMAGSQFVKAADQMELIWSAQQITAENAVAAFNADPLGTFAATGTLTTELDASLHDMAALAIRVHTAFPRSTSVCVNSTCYHNAGASLEQELAASIATATTYMQSMLGAGMSAQAAHDAIVFQTACDADTLTNVVKLRTLNVLWHHVATQLDVPLPALRLTVETSLRMQSTCEPWVNHLRNVSAATAAAMGGAQSIIVHPHNRVDGVYLDDDIDIGARVARNIAIILSEESAMTFVHDPMGGSYAIENLTKNLSDSTWQALQNLEQTGGLAQALTSGQWQLSIAKAHDNRTTRLAEDIDIQIGVNRYTNHALASTDTPVTSDQHGSSHAESTALNTKRDAVAYEDAS